MENKTNNEAVEYYKGARNWYFSIFTHALSERNFLAIISAMGGVVFLSMVYAAYFFFPLTPEKPYRIVSEDALGKIPTVRKLTKSPNKDLAVARFLLKEYTKSRENYNVRKIGRNRNMVRQFSSPEVMQEFLAYLSVSNPDSPITKYERHTIREIAITSSSIEKTENWENNKAAIHFTAFEQRGTEQKSDRWVAYITFNFAKISVNQDTGELSPLKLEVVDYHVKKIIK